MIRQTRSSAVEQGSATIYAVVVVGVLALVAMFCGALAGVVVSQRRAAAAADLAALAAASAVQQGAAPCGAARSVAAANGARIVTCDVRGVVVDVGVEVVAHTFLDLSVPLRASARAGPVTPGRTS